MIIHGAPNKKVFLGKKTVLNNTSLNPQTSNENNSTTNKNPENFSIESEKINYVTKGINNSNLNDQQTKITRELETTENKGKFTTLKENNSNQNNEQKIIPVNINKPITSGDEGLDHPVPLVSDYDEIRAEKYKNKLKNEIKQNYIDDDDLEDSENNEIYLRVIEKFNKNILPLNSKIIIIENKKNYLSNISTNVNPNINKNTNDKLENVNKPKINVEGSNVNKSKYEKNDNKIITKKNIIPNPNNQANQTSYQKINNKESQIKNNKNTSSKIPTPNLSKTIYNASNKKYPTSNFENDTRYKRQTIERGGKYNNIQTTYIVYTKKNCDVHLTKNFSAKRIESINQINKSHNSQYRNLKGSTNINNRGYNIYTADKKMNNNNAGGGTYIPVNKNTYTSSYIAKLNKEKNDNNKGNSINMSNNQRYGQYQNVSSSYNAAYRNRSKGQDCIRSEKNMILPNKGFTQHRYSYAGK